MNALTYTFETIEPLLATQPHSGEANSATSYGYVPGAVVRGALISAYLRATPNDAIQVDAMGRRLFFEETTRYLNAYPVALDDGQRLLPRPASWFIEKDQDLRPGVKIADFAAGGKDHEAAPVRPKPPRGEFCRFESIDLIDDEAEYGQESSSASLTKGTALYEAARQITVHNASSDRNQKRAGTSQVFRYDALAAGQSFMGAILSDSIEDLELLGELLRRDILRLGGAGAGGYGLVEVSRVDAPIPNWREYTPDNGSSNGRVIVTLLSDAILPRDALATEQLSRLFGAQRVDAAFYQLTLVGGFNRTWGLPLPQAWAVRAGSVFVLSGPIDEAQLKREGIGLRQLDGFGRIAVNWQMAPVMKLTEFGGRAAEAPALGSVGRAVAERMAERMLRDHLERQLLTRLSRYSRSAFGGLPSVAQLSRLRLAARRAHVQGHLQPITDHIKSLRKTSREQWKGATVGSRPLLEWLANLSNLDEPQFLDLFGTRSESLPSVAGRRAQLTPSMRLEFTARFIDGLMKQAVRVKKGEISTQGDKR